MINNFKKLKEYISSDEFKISVKSLAKKIAREDNILKSQIDRFHNKFGDAESFAFITEKIIQKYGGDKYRDMWYGRGIEPPENLYWFLYEYGKKYGRECNESEWNEYGNVFSSDLVYVNGYYFNLMNGQGTVINVIREK